MDCIGDSLPKPVGGRNRPERTLQAVCGTWDDNVCCCLCKLDLRVLGALQR